MLHLSDAKLSNTDFASGAGGNVSRAVVDCFKLGDFRCRMESTLKYAPPMNLVSAVIYGGKNWN